jgi:ATP-dependent helicase/nuclease subunit A
MTDTRAVDEQSRRLIRTELMTNFLVEAGAGSGKTHMLAARMAAGVASGVYRVDQMAAVTFTRKAASELRGRFHLALEAELAGASGKDPEQAERVRSALSNLERFFAGTIHSFCARLLRERPVESGVSPGFTELDEVQELELQGRVWRDFVTSARANGDPDMMALMAAEIRPRDLDSAFATVCVNDDVDFPPGEAECPDPAPAWKALDRFWKEFQKHLPARIDPGTKCPVQKVAQHFSRRLRVSTGRVDRPSVLAALLDIWDTEAKITQKWWTGSASERKRLRDLIEGLHSDFHTAVVEPYLDQWRQYVYRLSVGLLTRARESAAAERRRLNCLNYGDLLNLTARVLREDVQVRRALQQKYRYLLVDEFQDTDPVQAEIVFWLAEDGTSSPITSKGAEAPDWRKVGLRAGALFVVGDPKQSIYRFRRADIDIYNIVRGRFSEPAIGRVLPLTMNFRSVPALCGWANDVFRTRFPTEPTTYAPRFAALDVPEGKAATGGVFTLTSAGKGRDLQEEDARKIAAYIRSEVDAGRRQFRDFLILTRKKKDRIAPYADALEALNVPLEVSGAGAFGDSAEVRALTLLLRALAEPQDAVLLVAVLRGPLFGLSDPELFAFKQAGGWISVFHEPTAGADGSPQSRVEAAIGSLRKHYRWTRMLPAAAALDRILEDTGYLALAATTPGGVDAGDILHAVDRVRQVVEDGGSLADAADALEADGEAANEVESLPLEPGRTDVVRLMNLHKAKGLEADVVFLADPAGGFTPRVDVHVERSELKARGWLQVVRKSEGSFNAPVLGEHVDWPAHAAAERPYLDAEQDRLLYVAATRAREMLVVSRSTGCTRGTPAWGALNNFLTSAEELQIPFSVSVASGAPLDCSVAAQSGAVASLATAHARVVEPSWEITSATAEAHHIARMARSVEISADDPSKVVTTDTAAHRADAGLAWGALIHGLLEHAMRHKAATRADLRRLAMWLTIDEQQLRPVVEHALDTVERAAGAEFWQSAQAHEHSAETPFSVRETERRVTNGVIDLLFQRGDGWQIVDYKTDVGLGNSIEAYQRQVAAYVRALEACGLENVGAELQSIRSVQDPGAN